MEKTPTFRVQAFGDYYLLQRIAVGGMAEIFKAKQVGVRGFEKIVVIKKILQHLSEDPEFVEMFEDEAKIAAQLTQANIVQIYELGEVDATLYITMEWIDGKNLRDVTRAASQRGIHLSLEQAVYLMLEVLKGLDYAHRKIDSKGVPLTIVHRDMSPQNIIVSYEGEVKILDFGIAKAASKISKTEAGVLKGKFSYMSPEQASGKIIDQRSDIYACGVILHELLTSDRLFRSKTDMETLERVKEGKVALPSEKNADIPPELDRIVLKSLAKDPRNRYQTAGEMLTDLNRLSHDQKFSHSSQELAAFMKTLFAEVIEQEKGRLLYSLQNIPEKSPAEPLTNARTHIAFKRAPGDNNGKIQEFERNTDGTRTVEARMGSATKAKILRVLTVICLLTAAVFLYLRPNPYSKNPNDPSGHISLREQIAELLGKKPEPSAPIPDDQLEQLKKAEETNPEVKPATPIPQEDGERVIVGSTPAPQEQAKKIDEDFRHLQAHEEITPKTKPNTKPKAPAKKDSSKKPTQASKKKESSEKEKRSAPPKKLGAGKIDMVAPPEGFAQLSIDGESYGTVPGAKARAIPLKEGKHSIKCQTPSRTYEGTIKIKADDRLTIKCESLK